MPGLNPKPLTHAPSESVLEMLAALNINPFQEMARLALHDETPIPTRATLWIALAKYCRPQLRAVEIESAQGDLFEDHMKTAMRLLRQELGLLE